MRRQCCLILVWWFWSFWWKSKHEFWRMERGYENMKIAWWQTLWKIWWIWSLFVKIRTIIVVNSRGETKISKSCDRQIWQKCTFSWKSRQRWSRGTVLESFHIARMGSEQIKPIWSVWGKLEWLWQFWEPWWKYEIHFAGKSRLRWYYRWLRGINLGGFHIAMMSSGVKGLQVCSNPLLVTI